MDNDPASSIRFHRISEFHCVTNALHVIVEACNSYDIKPSDWIGLFLVGWSSVDQYVTKQNVSSPGSTLFPAESLPHDTSNFYQLCYFDNSNNLLGISTTFSFIGEGNSFITDAAGDGVIVDVNDFDSEDVVLVKTSRSLLENALGKAIQEKLSLQKSLTEQGEVNRQLTEQLNALNADFSRVQLELKIVSEEKSKADTLESETKKNHSTLSAENERLDRRVRELEKDFDRVKGQLTVGDETRLKLTTENQEMSGRLRELNKHGVEQQQMAERLEESLRNAEERLQVNEDLKRMLQQEVDSLMAVQRSLAARLEDAKGECHSLKTKCAKMEKELDEKKRSQTASEERFSELERAHSDVVLKFLSQKEQTDEAEKKLADLKLRLEKAADEYRALYRQVHRKEGTLSPRRAESSSTSPPAAAPVVAAASPPLTASVASSLPAMVKCPLCDKSIASSEIQSHFQAHDEQQEDSINVRMPICPICNKRFLAEEVQGHVENHFES